MPDTTERLRAIKTFTELVRYLEDELDWPLAEYDFPDITFEYSPAELGLKDEDAAKVKTIHQLRPLQHGQPWGIFFVEFENKRMPVVVLRRILSHLVLKQRASANKEREASWHLDDLLFISAFGEESTDQREIAFAHFHQEAGDLPTLRVLGWDGADTVLKLDHVAATLRERLRWPDDTANSDAWREQWSRAFRHRLGHVIRTADALADRLALLARGIRDAARTLMGHESESGQLRRLHKAFQTALIHDLTEEDFADTYAQTVTYGLLTAAISRTDMSDGRHGTFIIAENVTDMVPITNPFLREMLQTFLQAGGRQGGIDFDELGIQDVVDLLRGDETDLPAILRDFGNRTQSEDPVIHFYEHFLSAYNMQLKIQRGVFYTPKPIVSYIVRSVHELLQTEFGIEDGLASTTTWGEMAQRCVGLQIPEGADPKSPFVVVLDPATGTATFLVEVIDVIHRTLTAKWRQRRLTETQQRDAWNDYVPQHLLPRLHGYELMMAPYAIAHMKIGLKLYETGYRFGSVERARVYLTNALEPAPENDQQLTFAGWSSALAHEAQAVNAIKRHQRFTVLIGNPPYAGISSNMAEYAQRLVEPYKNVGAEALNERKLWLQDDYVKFIRVGQATLELTGCGLLGYITNHGYLDNPTFRGMRWNLLETFPYVRVLDLHGNSKKKQAAPDGCADANVFDIQQGVAVAVMSKPPRLPSAKQVRHSDLWGTRESKNSFLRDKSIGSTAWNVLNPAPEFYLLIPHDSALKQEYEFGWKVTDIFQTGGVGVVTARDSMTVCMNAGELWARVNDFASLPPEKARIKYSLGDDARDWRVGTAQADVRASGPNPKKISPILYRPFDFRFTYYTGNSRGFYASPCEKVMRHMLGDANKALAVARSVEIGRYEHVFCTNRIIGHHSVSLKEVNYLFPLYLYPEENAPRTLLPEDRHPRHNLSSAFLKSLSNSVGLHQIDKHGLPDGLTPEDIFHYTYGVLHSPNYRSRYADFLKSDFPRLPLAGSLDLFRTLAEIGGELVALHLMKSPMINQHVTAIVGSSQLVVEKVSYAHEAVWLNKAQTFGFRGVPEAVWNFHIGGYQVCEKWLKDRKGRVLSAEDVEHYHQIVVALSETIRLMQEIDEVIEEHGGWPGAFAATID